MFRFIWISFMSTVTYFYLPAISDKIQLMTAKLMPSAYSTKSITNVVDNVMNKYIECGFKNINVL